MIRNTDGSSYRLSGTMQVFDPESREKDLFNQYDAEIIRINGTPVFYHDVFIDGNTIDGVYHEARSKVFSQTGICLYAYYDPIASQNFQNVFGIDSPDSIVFEFNYADVLDRLGHPPKIGARIFTTHKAENWVIKYRAPADWRLWQEVRLQVECDRFQESLTTGEGNVSQSQTGFKIN